MSGYVSNSLRNGLIKAHAAQAQAASPFKLARLNANGVPSKMHDAVTHHRTEAAALADVTQRRALNPGRTLRFALNGVEV